MVACLNEFRKFPYLNRWRQWSTVFTAVLMESTWPNEVEIRDRIRIRPHQQYENFESFPLYTVAEFTPLQYVLLFNLRYNGPFSG